MAENTNFVYYNKSYLVSSNKFCSASPAKLYRLRLFTHTAQGKGANTCLRLKQQSQVFFSS